MMQGKYKGFTIAFYNLNWAVLHPLFKDSTYRFSTIQGCKNLIDNYLQVLDEQEPQRYNVVKIPFHRYSINSKDNVFLRYAYAITRFTDGEYFIVNTLLVRRVNDRKFRFIRPYTNQNRTVYNYDDEVPTVVTSEGCLTLQDGLCDLDFREDTFTRADYFLGTSFENYERFKVRELCPTDDRFIILQTSETTQTIEALLKLCRIKDSLKKCIVSKEYSSFSQEKKTEIKQDLEGVENDILKIHSLLFEFQKDCIEAIQLEKSNANH